MNTALKVSGFLAALVVLFGVAAGIGRAVDPVSASEEPPVGDGHTGTPEVTLSVSRDGQPVRDLQPYLGAYGHLHLDFRHDGVVRTAAFTVTIAGSTRTEPKASNSGDGNADH